MKLKLQNKFLVFNELKDRELSWLYKTLTFENKNGEEDTCILYESEDKSYYYTFWGLYKVLKERCPYEMELNEDIDFIDLTYQNENVPANILAGIELFDFQIYSVKKALIKLRGLINITTGGGKTECMLAFIRTRLNQGFNNILIICPTTGLADQFYERAILRGFNKDEISTYHNKAAPRITPVIVAVVNSVYGVLANEEKNTELYNKFKSTKILIYDESHHLAATTYRFIDLVINPYQCLGYTASAFNENDVLKNPNDALLYGLTGGIFYKIGQAYIQSLGLIAEPVVFTKVVNKTFKIPAYQARFDTIYKKNIVTNKTRNETIAQVTQKFTNLNFKVLILVQQLEHARLLMTLLKGKKIISVFGGGQGLEYNEQGFLEETVVDYNTFRKNFVAGCWDIVIGSQVFDEGFDLAGIGAVILAGAGKSKIKLIQRIGRGLRRKLTGRNRVYIYDFWDFSHVYLLAQSKKRRALMKDMDATIHNEEVYYWKEVIQHSEELLKIKSLQKNENKE